MLPLITLQPLYYRGQESMALYFSENKELEQIIRRMKGVKWCVPHSCWYLPLTKEQYYELSLVTNGKASLHTHALKAYLQQRKTIAASPQQKSKRIAKQQAALLIELPLSESNLKAFTDCF